MTTIILSIIIVGLLVLYIARAYTDIRLRLAVKAALKAADEYKPGGRDHIRMPYNAAARLVNWKSDNYPQRSDKEFNRKPGGVHPALLSAAKRGSLSR